MSYQLICQLQKKAIPVTHCCRLLEVSRSGYYDARRRSAKPVLCKTSVHLKAGECQEFCVSEVSCEFQDCVTSMP